MLFFSRASAPESDIRNKLELNRQELECAESIFNAAANDAVTESAIYRILSLSVYRDYLYAQARQNEMIKE